MDSSAFCSRNSAIPWARPIAKRIAVEGGKYLNLVIEGGNLPVLAGAIHILGLRASAHILEAIEPALPQGPLRAALEQVTEFANEAGKNLDIAGPLIDRLAQPIEVHKVAVGGSSISDFTSTAGRDGYFQHRFCVYDRAGQPCPRKDGGTILRSVHQGRSSFFCPKCQK